MAQYLLKLSFDERQVTQSLAYEFATNGKSNKPYPIQDDGPLAGTFNFQKGDEIFVEVTTTTAEFVVSNCTLVSIPARMTEFLSLFDHASACTTLDEWHDVQHAPKGSKFSRRSVKPLTVVTQNGQWQISGYLSVQLPANGQTPSEDGVRHQLYYFDPESSSGTGGGYNY